MFHDTPDRVAARMRLLEEWDAVDREDGTDFPRRLRQVPASTGRFLALTAAGSPPGEWIEIGTSGGYSALWLSLACRAAGRTLTTFENDGRKLTIAAETFREAGVDDVVTLVAADARLPVGERDTIAFCFLDALKELYLECYELVVPRLVSGGLLVADNVLSHEDELAPFVGRVLADERVDAMVLPLDRGVLVCRRAESAEAG